MRWVWLGVAAAGIGLAVPATAAAHDAYVNQGTGADASNDCSLSTAPCRTLARGLGQVSPGDTVFVAGGYTYNHSTDIGANTSLIHKNFGGATGPAILDNSGAGQPDITVSGPASVEGFTIRSDDLPMEVDSSVQIREDVFDTPAAVPEEIHVDDNNSPSVFIHHSRFVDPTPLTDSSAQQMAIDDVGPSLVVVGNNRFKDFWVGIQVDNPIGALDATNNTFTGTHDLTGNQGTSIYAEQALGVDIFNNRLVLKPVGFVAGIVVDAQAVIEGNLVEGYSNGIAVDDTTYNDPIRDDAVINPDSHAVGIQVSDYDAPDPKRDAAISHVTVWGPGEAIELQKAQIKVDSSLLGGKGIKAFYGGDSCKIKRSRGPTKKHSATGCKDVQTTANPKLKHDHIHLKGSSPMIDRGGRTRLKGERDIDGQPRRLPGNCGSRHPHKRTDIGADEYRCPKR